MTTPTHGPPIEDFALKGQLRNAPEITFTGRQLGHGSTHQPFHSGHPDMPFTRRGERCGACRWFEVYIYEVIDEKSRYLVYTVGRSTIPNEVDLVNAYWTNSAPEILEILTIRKEGSEPFLPAPSARALASAAGFDRGIKEAYFNRAVI